MMEPTGTIEDVIKDLLSGDEEAAREYLKESFLLQAMSALFHARRAAGLTQAQLAERLHTRQSSIARLERAMSGSVTLKRFVEVAIACGVMPLDMTLVPVQEMIQFAGDNAETPRTQVAFSAWRAGHESPSLAFAPQLVATAPTQANVIQQASSPLPQGHLVSGGLWPETVWGSYGGGQAA